MREEGTRRSKVNLGRGLIGLNARTLCHPTCDDSERRCGEDGVRSVPESILGSPRLLFGPSGTGETARAEWRATRTRRRQRFVRPVWKLYTPPFPRLLTSRACSSRGTNAHFASAFQTLRTRAPARPVQLEAASSLEARLAPPAIADHRQIFQLDGHRHYGCGTSDMPWQSTYTRTCCRRECRRIPLLFGK